MMLRTPYRPAHKLARLIRLVTEIKADPYQSPATLLDTLKVSKAQFYKDREELKEAGFTFHYDRTARRFILDADPYIPVHHLTLSETFALTMAVRQLSAAGDFLLTYDALGAIKKLIAAAPTTQRDLLQPSLDDIVLQQGFGCQASILEDLQRAATEQRRIIIRYGYNREGPLKDYTLDPYQIYFKRRALYLDAYCPEEGGYRIFRINRVREVRFTGMIVPRRSDYSFAQRHRNSFSVFVGNKVEKVKIRFSKRIAPFIRETCWHLSQQITEEPDGSILFQVEVSEPREVGWWVIQWGPEAKVLEPESLRQEVANMATGIVKVYEKI
jgi:predicted DNA-binding transcriptional regulator YafY